MPRLPDYTTPIQEALYLLEDAKITTFPINFDKIQKQFSNLFVYCSYKDFIKGNKITREQFINFLGTDEGASIYSSTTNKYIIYYNEQKPKKRIRFTKAHELGHIFLGHHLDYGKELLNGKGLNNKIYNSLEREANCFARNLLCPAFHTDTLLKSHGIEKQKFRNNYNWIKTKDTNITKTLSSTIDAETLIETAFDVSSIAAITRLAFLNLDIKKYKNNPIDWKTTSKIKHTATWVCSTCGYERLNSAKHCSECGNTTFVYNVSKVNLNNLNLTKSNQFSVCPICGNSQYSENANFCKICGIPLYNQCTMNSNHLNPPGAKYCYDCGNITDFYNKKLIPTKISNQKVSVLMKYENNIEYDAITKKIKKCPRCFNEEFSDDAFYCKICGLELINKCTGIPYADDFGNYPGQIHDNSPDARFCETCGASTVYNDRKILKSYIEIQEENKKDIPF